MVMKEKLSIKNFSKDSWVLDGSYKNYTQSVCNDCTFH